MALISTQKTTPSRRQIAPQGMECPHCQQRNRIFYSRLQNQRPFHKRIVFAYLRCHSCTHVFRCWRIGPMLFWAGTLAAIMLMGIVAI